MYSLRNVTRIYGGVRAIQDVTCQIRTAGIAVIMGPSGAGKSTLLRLLSFVERPDQGDFMLELGEHIFFSGLSSPPWPMVTCVFQGRFLWPHLTLRRNIELPLRNLGKSEAYQRSEEVINLFGMESFVDRFPHEVSGGQAQRAALARALVLKPRLILIDEAHVGLDLIQQENLNEHLVRLKAMGVGIVAVTHSLNFAKRFADEIIIVEENRISEIGPWSILEHPSSRFLSSLKSSDFV